MSIRFGLKGIGAMAVIGLALNVYVKIFFLIDKVKCFKFFSYNIKLPRIVNGFFRLHQLLNLLRIEKSQKSFI